MADMRSEPLSPLKMDSNKDQPPRERGIRLHRDMNILPEISVPEHNHLDTTPLVEINVLTDFFFPSKKKSFKILISIENLLVANKLGSIK
ncbi:hypothetical protein CEXT_28261 [Caerostris extrusa]|uniref:Uncharacterized protein n=1 Tax=Caerostris extrusa TaxID=172846 RepID=A0AAV4TY56_CAEEX|nr:hypothetical protein CEXT_28261 [Caerostris extrusa]